MLIRSKHSGVILAERMYRYASLSMTPGDSSWLFQSFLCFLNVRSRSFKAKVKNESLIGNRDIMYIFKAIEQNFMAFYA